MSLVSNWLRELRIIGPPDPSLFSDLKYYVEYAPGYTNFGNLIYTGHISYISKDALRIAYPLGD